MLTWQQNFWISAIFLGYSPYQAIRVQRKSFAEANIYQPKHHFNQPQKRFDEQILIQQFFCNLNFSKKLRLPVRRVNNRIHQPNSKIHQSWAIRHYFLCTLSHVKKLWATVLFLTKKKNNQADDQRSYLSTFFFFHICRKMIS